MANLQATLRNQTLSNKMILECIAKANRFLYLNTEPNKFVTLFCGVLDPEAKKFTYVNCGHNYPFHLNNKGEFTALDKGGIVLGLLPEYPFEKERVYFKPGESIVIYSDGVTEAENRFEELFGEDRLKSVVLENRHLTAHEIVDQIYNEVRKFSDTKKQDEDIMLEDDVTMVVIKAL
jgi:sigma-B regulation protein RsbU (phosphoserine phosphatase)